MRFLKWAAAALLVLILVVLSVGLALPRHHTAKVRTVIHAPAESLYAAIVDVERGTAWRSGLEKVEVLDREPLLWRETAEWGEITFVRDEATSPVRVVTRIADESEGFGGTWTYEIAASPTQESSTLTITENGSVSNPMFRFLSRFVFGHYTSLETYARDLGRRFGDAEVQPERID